MDSIMKKPILAAIIMMTTVTVPADENNQNILPKHIREEIAEQVLMPCNSATSDVDVKSRDMLSDLMQVMIDATGWIADREQRIANEPDITERYRIYKEAIDFCIDEVNKVVDSYGIPSYSDIAEEVEKNVAKPCVDAMVARTVSWHDIIDDPELLEKMEKFTKEVEEAKTPEEKVEDRNDARKKIDKFIQGVIDVTYKYRMGVNKTERIRLQKQAGKECAEEMTS